MCARLDAEDVTKARLIDATPIGANVRSTVATYSNVLDDLRRLFAATSEAQKRGRTLKDFSYNTGSLALPRLATARDRYRSTCSSCPTWT